MSEPLYDPTYRELESFKSEVLRKFDEIMEQLREIRSQLKEKNDE